MNQPVDPDRTRLDLNPADTPYPAGTPGGPASAPAPAPAAVVGDEVTDADQSRRRTVSIVSTIINVVCGIFAVVLAVHIVLVLGEANQGNGFASFVDSFSKAVSLGLRDLFVPDNPKVRTFLNDGVAAIAWLAIGALLTYLLRRLALPGPRRVQRRYLVR
jgi:hypothetical protein